VAPPRTVRNTLRLKIRSRAHSDLCALLRIFSRSVFRTVRGGATSATPRTVYVCPLPFPATDSRVLKPLHYASSSLVRGSPRTPPSRDSSSFSSPVFVLPNQQCGASTRQIQSACCGAGMGGSGRGGHTGGDSERKARGICCNTVPIRPWLQATSTGFRHPTTPSTARTNARPPMLARLIRCLCSWEKGSVRELASAV
jgi:hypothetical protein